MVGSPQRSLSGSTHAARTPALILGPPFQCRMTERRFKPGESWLFVLHGRFPAGAGGVDEIVSLGSTQSAHVSCSSLFTMPASSCEQLQSTALLSN
jgi:hypothetical protein